MSCSILEVEGREGVGRRITRTRLLRLMFNTPERSGGGGREALGWRHVEVGATIYAESGGYEWRRPMVVDPDAPHHLSVDRGICAFNSYWWSHLADRECFDWTSAVGHMLLFCHKQGMARTFGSSPWDWSPILDFYWNAHGTKLYDEEVPKFNSRARDKGWLT